ncbi:Cation/H(+) antiporter like [Thalictrum thalictroides]|uniref:Cation/H(+) antiporter like n=1 Tax=Thalictrum thalictroides TaxID=46969 RepID=A0A7J6W3M6_THATH|nr:Cation/H(+) antiporter like [Thalictrum thalictroides]
MATGKNVTAINGTEASIVCYAPKMVLANGLWNGDNPLDYSVPLFILQSMLIVCTTRIVVFILKPLRQPKVVSEILGGVILGPSGFGKIKLFADSVFPMRSIMMLETAANIGLLYFLFLVGVEMDLTVIRRTGREAMVIAVAGMSLPFFIGVGIGLVLQTSGSLNYEFSFLLFLGVSVSATAFPVLARILADLKLLNTDLGRISMSAALINDMAAWILLALAITLSESTDTPLAAIEIVLSATAFVFFCMYVLRPAIKKLALSIPEGESINEFYVCIILTGVVLCGFITDSIGTHSIFGAFVFGLIIPNGPLGTALIEKIEDFVTSLLLPLFFAISGLRTDLGSIKNGSDFGILFGIIILAGVGKVGATLFVSLYYNKSFYDGFALGMLMNTKGLIEVIVLNVGRDQKVLNEQTFSVMVLSAVVMTGIAVPVVLAIYKPTRPSIINTYRTIQTSSLDAELKILVCVHSPRNVPTIINLIEVSHTKKSPICVYTLHLVELTGRASAMLIVHNAHKSGQPAINRTQAQSDHIIFTFANYAQHAGCVTVQPLTAISPYSTMHEDICNLAEDKRVSLIIIPFHKQQTIDGGMEVSNPVFRNINENVLANAPCSVGLLIDRGFGSSTKVTTNFISNHIAVLFFGGPDDREALSYAWRMSDHPSVTLTVVRFLPGDAVEPTMLPHDKDYMSVNMDNERELQLDNEYISKFRLKNVSKETIVYKEEVVNNAEETLAAIRTIDNIHNLYMVGKGQGIISPLTAGLSDWIDCPELGTIGDLLASSDFTGTVSVLVVQQYVGEKKHGDIVGTSEHPALRSNW